MENEITLLTTEEAAKRIGITRQGLSYLVKQGKIRPMKNIKGKYQFFNEEEIYKYLNEK